MAPPVEQVALEKPGPTSPAQFSYPGVPGVGGAYPTPARRWSSGTKIILWIAGGVVGSTLLCCGGGAIWLFSSIYRIEQQGRVQHAEAVQRHKALEEQQRQAKEQARVDASASNRVPPQTTSDGSRSASLPASGNTQPAAQPGVSRREPTSDVGGIPLPELTLTDRRQIQTIALPSGRVAWAVTPDPAGTASSPLLAQPLSLGDGDTISTIHFSDPAAGQVVLGRRTRNRGKDRKHYQTDVAPTDPAWLDAYDLASGTHLRRLDVPHGSFLVDVSPDGSRALLAHGDRLDVWTLDGQHVAGWLPHSQEIENYRPWGALIDNDHVLTVVDHKKLVLWRLPACRAVYVIEGFRDSLPYSDPTVVVTPGRRFFSTLMTKKATPSVLLFFDALSGQLRGVAPAPSPAQGSGWHWNGLPCADGQSLALSFLREGSHVLAQLDLKTGSLAFETAVRSNSFQWAGSRHLLFQGGDGGRVVHRDRLLFDLVRRSFVWKYQIPLGASPFKETADGRLVFRVSTQNAGIWLAAVTLPEPQTLQTIDATTPASPSELLLGPGSSVSLQVDLAGPDNLADAVRQDFSKKLQAHGIRVAEGQPLRVVARSEVVKTEQIPYRLKRTLGSPMDTITFTFTQMKFLVDVQDGQGRSLWGIHQTVRPQMPDERSMRKIDELRNELENQHWVEGKQWLLSLGLPRTIFATERPDLPQSNVVMPDLAERPRPGR